MGEGIPDEDLFQEDTEQWLRKHIPDLSEEQLNDQLQMIRVATLLDFYQNVAKRYPKLLEKLPKVPKIVVDRSGQSHNSVSHT